MEAIIVINAYTRSEAELNQPRRIGQELEARGVKTKLVRNSPAALCERADFCVYLDKDKYAAQALEKRMRLFNRAEAIETCDDKMLTYLALEGLPQPETVSSLLCYTPDRPASEELVREAERRFGYPLVVKENHGSLGRQVYLAENRTELEALSERLKFVPHLYQKFIDTSRGRDVRVICVGGEVIACMLRTSQTDFRSNISLGGRGEPYPVTEEIRTLAKRVSETLDLDYCGIDLLFGERGMLVCEVNSNAFFGGIERVTGVNVAGRYAEHIIRTMSR